MEVIHSMPTNLAVTIATVQVRRGHNISRMTLQYSQVDPPIFSG